MRDFSFLCVVVINGHRVEGDYHGTPVCGLNFFHFFYRVIFCGLLCSTVCSSRCLVGSPWVYLACLSWDVATEVIMVYVKVVHIHFRAFQFESKVLMSCASACNTSSMIYQFCFSCFFFLLSPRTERFISSAKQFVKHRLVLGCLKPSWVYFLVSRGAWCLHTFILWSLFLSASFLFF